MGSQKNRDVRSWNKTWFRYYLKGLAYALICKKYNESSLIAKVTKMIPDWRDEFVEVGKQPITGHALYERAERARRYRDDPDQDERPKTQEEKDCWAHAERDAETGICTYPRTAETATVYEKPKLEIVSPQVTPSHGGFFYAWSSVDEWGTRTTVAGHTEQENPWDRILQHSKGAGNDFPLLVVFAIYNGSAKELDAKYASDWKMSRKSAVGNSKEVYDMPIDIAVFHVRKFAHELRLGLRQLGSDELEELYQLKMGRKSA